MIDFRTLKRPKSPNTYLVCDHEYCPNSEADHTPYVFDWPQDEVLDVWHDIIAKEERVKRIGADPETNTYEYTQKSRLVGFTDVFTIRFISTSKGLATKVIVYSRSKTGYSDLGVNMKRTKRWLGKLERLLRHPN